AIRVADRDIAARFEAMRDDSPVLAVAQPLSEVPCRRSEYLGQRCRRRVTELIEHVSQLGILGSAAGVGDVPEGFRLGRRRLGIETADVELIEICGYMLDAAVGVVLP